MKIALLTYHRSYNFGALLQAVATMYVLRQMGHEVYFINYWPDHQRILYKDISIRKAISDSRKYGLFSILKLSYKWLWQFIRKCKYEHFICKYISPFYGDKSTDYDVLVCGSDQIWRKQPVTKSYNPYYFGDNDIKALKRMSFASSMGRLPESDDDKRVVNKLLEHLDYISVREKNLCDYILANTSKKPELVLDPTLMLTKEQWENCLSLEPESNAEPYVLVYDLGLRFSQDEIYTFAMKNGLIVKKTIQWIDFPEQRKKPVFDNPKDFVKLVRNASFVLTSSFHGMAFSIVFNKPFYVTSLSNTDRFSSLLNCLGLQDRWLSNAEISNLECIPIDYTVVQKKMIDLRKQSEDFLVKTLSDKH